MQKLRTQRATRSHQNIVAHDGFHKVPFGQDFRDMSNSTKELMRQVLAGTLRHYRHSVLRWNIDNVYVRTDVTVK